MFKMLSAVCIVSFIIFSGCSSDSGSGGAGGNKSPDTKPVATDCSTLRTSAGREMQYCLRLSSTNSHPKNIIYVLHGLGGDASVIYSDNALGISFGNFYQYAEQVFGSEMPHLVSISFGPDATLPLENNARDYYSVLELTDSLMPQIEAKLGYSTYNPPRRHLFGMSLGGFNALNIASLMAPRFASISVVCPALIDFDPFNSAEVDAFVKRNASSVNRSLVDYFIKTIRTRYGSNQVFQSRNPIQLMLSGRLDRLPLFISTGRQDDFGFYEGSSAFYTQAILNKKDNVQFYSAPGHHCDFSMPDLARFLRGQIVGP